MADILVDPLGLIAIIFAIIAGFIGSFTLVWRVSKNYNDQKIKQDLQDAEIVAMKLKLVELDNGMQATFDKFRIERREEIAKAVSNQHDRFQALQSQIDGIKLDVKDSTSKIEIVKTKVETHENDITRVNNRIDKNIDFFTTWNQRIEDSVIKAEARVNILIADGKRELMGMMNMLVNATNGRKK